MSATRLIVSDDSVAVPYAPTSSPTPLLPRAAAVLETLRLW